MSSLSSLPTPRSTARNLDRLPDRGCSFIRYRLVIFDSLISPESTPKSPTPGCTQCRDLGRINAGHILPWEHSRDLTTAGELSLLLPTLEPLFFFFFTGKNNSLGNLIEHLLVCSSTISLYCLCFFPHSLLSNRGFTRRRAQKLVSECHTFRCDAATWALVATEPGISMSTQSMVRWCDLLDAMFY